MTMLLISAYKTSDLSKKNKILQLAPILAFLRIEQNRWSSFCQLPHSHTWVLHQTSRLLVTSAICTHRLSSSWRQHLNSTSFLETSLFRTSLFFFFTLFLSLQWQTPDVKPYVQFIKSCFFFFPSKHEKYDNLLHLGLFFPS